MIDYEIPNAKWAGVDLVGEYFRRSSIVKLIGGRPKGDDSKRVDLPVHLVPEPDNPFGSHGQAVSARIDDQVVGYLSNEDAKKWHPEIHRIAASGAVAKTTGNVLAYNRHKWDRNGRTTLELEVNIRVALPDPGLLLPLNTQKFNNVAILPWGNALQVTGEDQHLPHLFEYVPASGEGLVVLTMHHIEKTLKNGSIRELVEVRLDDERVGQLTAASSLHFLPTIAHAHDMDRTLAVWSKLKGSGLAVELTVQGARATDLKDDWLRTMPSLPEFVPEAPSYDVPDAYVPEKAPTKAKRPAGQKQIQSEPTSDATSINGFRPTEGPRIEYLGGQENSASYTNGKRQVKFGDKQRRFSPGTYSTAAWMVLIACCLLGLISLAGAPIGLVFTALFVGVGVLIFRGQKFVAEALKFEQMQQSLS